MTDPTPPDPVSPFVSSTTAPVFALRNLPEEIAAVLFAYYSRSPVDLRTSLRAMIADGFVPPPPGGGITAEARERAAAFHRKWVVGYSHGSVGEHAVLHIGIEGLSCLAAKAVEDCRLGTAFTEKSTRYVPFTADSALSAAEAGLDPDKYEGLYADFDGARVTLMRAYLRAVDAYTELAPEGTSSARRAWALDRARQLLPVGTKTSLGLTVNGRALRAMVRKLRADPHPEVRALADALAAVGESELPGLLAECPPAHPGRVAAWAGVYAGAGRAVAEPGAVVNDIRTVGTGVPLPLPSTPLARDFERVVVELDLRCSYAAWRDLQRHRVFSAAPVRVHPRSAVELIDGGILPDDVQRECFGAILRAVDVAERLTARGDGHLAEYILLMGTLIQARMSGNLRGLAHLITLRSGKQGHDSYRTVAQQLHQQLTELAPDIAAAIPCDYEPRDFARK